MLPHHLAKEMGKQNRLPISLALFYGVLFFLISDAFAQISICCCEAAVDPGRQGGRDAPHGACAGLGAALLPKEHGDSDHSACCPRSAGPLKQAWQVPRAQEGLELVVITGFGFSPQEP